MALDLEAVAREYPADKDGSVYLNSGCCGCKPSSVLDSVSRFYQTFKRNPCHFTFNDTAPVDQARLAVSRLLNVPVETIMLAFSTTNALQILMQSFLLEDGDELITTDHEHGSLRTIAKYLAETRGIIIKKYQFPSSNNVAANDSKTLCQGLLSLVSEKTKLVAISEIFSYTGWRPDLTELVNGLADENVPFLADCAHGPGQIRCHPERYPMWVGSGHKWLGAPNGCAFAYVSPELAERLVPVALGDTFFAKKEANAADLSRLEGTGTADLAKYRGLTRAIDLHLTLGIEAVVSYQLELAKYLRQQLSATFKPIFRTLDCFECAPERCTSILNFRFEKEQLKVPDLQVYLWENHKIAVQLDYLNVEPGLGMRVSCHLSNTKDDMDRLLYALNLVVIK